MNRSLKLSMLVALALGSGHAMAVSLGQAQVKSALGQPLLVEVPLNPASPAELRNLTVRLAPNEAYVRAGITAGRTSVPLRFTVVNRAGGKAIRITSTAPVGDPYLDLLLEVKGGGSTSVREVAILLDPPGAVSAAPVAQTRAASTPQPTRSTQTTSAAPASRPVSAAPKAGSDGKYGPVERGQTLTGIAQKTLPAGIDINQMLLAYKQANPDAFYKDNVNALKSGAVLRVPSAADARAMAAASALADVRRQNSDWRAGGTSKPVALADAGTRPASKDSSGDAASELSDRLALVPAKNGSKGAPSTSAGGNDGSAKGVRQELLRTKESVASLQQQGEELKSRLDDQTDINDKNKSLLALKDSQIADLQNKLASARKAANLPAESAPVAATPPDASMAEVADSNSAMDSATPLTDAPMTAPAASTGAMPSTAADSMAAMPATTSVATAAPTPVTPAAAPVSKPLPTPKRVEQPWYMQTWAWAAAAGVVVLLLLLAMLGRRKADKPPAKASASLADRFSAGAPLAAESDGEVMPTSDDVAQDELLDQLAEHPDDIHLHLELVTLYYARRDVEHFEAAAEAMYAHVSDPQQREWQAVVQMGEDLTPQHPLFTAHDDDPVSEVDARQTFDIDEYSADEAGAALPPVPQSRPVSEYNYDFDLTGRRPETPSGVPMDDAEIHPVVGDAEPMIVPDAPLADAPLTDPAEDDLDSDFNADEFSDDPVDTKLDLARAYLDMGDADGARAMLEEVVKEGTQIQQDTAKGLLQNMA